MNPITRASTIEARLVDHCWLWAEENAEEIRAHWDKRKADRPAMFNGRVLMIAEAEVEGDTLHARFFETDYANLLAWLDFGAPDRSVQNGFAMGALTSSDGAFVLGVMGPHTSQAGRVYFPAGTPDRGDLRPDGSVDLIGSITREIEEETGLTPENYAVAPDWILVRVDGYAALMREVRLPWPARTARDRILAHLARDAIPELATITIVRGQSDIDEAVMPTYLQAFLRWRFATRSSEGDQR